MSVKTLNFIIPFNPGKQENSREKEEREVREREKEERGRGHLYISVSRIFFNTTTMSESNVFPIHIGSFGGEGGLF